MSIRENDFKEFAKNAKRVENANYETEFASYTLQVSEPIRKTYQNLAKHCVRLHENFSPLQEESQFMKVEEMNNNYKMCKNITKSFEVDYSNSIEEAKNFFYECKSKRSYFPKDFISIDVNYNCKKGTFEVFLDSLQNKEANLLNNYLNNL